MKILKVFYIIIVLCFLTSTIYSQKNEITENKSDSILLLNEIIITAYQTDSKLQKILGSISVLNQEDLSISDGNNLSTVLNSTPGIYMHNGTYATNRIVIRGIGSRTPYNTNRVKSYLNDIPITSSDGISSPEDIDLLHIERIEIIKGPASTLYGSGLGGNINIYTPQKKHNEINALAQYGSFNSLKTGISGNLKLNDLSLYGSVNHLQSDGYRENNHFNRTSFLTSGKWNRPAFSLEYTFLWMNLDAGIPSSIGKTLFETNPKAAAANWKAIKGSKKYDRGVGGFTLSNNISANLTNRLTVFNRWMNNFENRPFNNLDEGTLSFGFRDKLNYHLEKWDFVAGIEFVNDTYKWELDLNDRLINKNKENRNQLNIFGLAYFRPTEKWNISIGGAINKINYNLTDLFPENGDQSGSWSFPFIFSPRLGVNYSPNKSFAIFSSIGHGFSMPSPEETLLPDGDINKDIKPEQGIQSEIGTRLNLFENKTQIEVALYQINLSNLLVTKRITEDIFTGINAGKTRHQGLELALRQSIFSYPNFPGKLNLRASYTLSDNYFIDFEDDGVIYNNKKLPGIPSQIGQTGINWELTNALTFQSQLLFASSQWLNDANSEKTDGYFTLLLKADYKFHIKKVGIFEVYAGINNLTDAKYASMISVNALSVGGNEPRYYYPGLPRHYFGGVRWYFGK